MNLHLKLLGNACQNISGTVVAIGNFDGVHAGHQAVLAAARAEARCLGVPCIALMFAPHPRLVIAKARGVRLEKDGAITPMSEKVRRLWQAGADAVAVLRFTPAVAALSAPDFCRQVLTGKLNAKAVFVGEDFCFGKARSGTVETLQEQGALLGFTAHPVPHVLCEDGMRISSSRIRQALKNGDVEPAAAWLKTAHTLRLNLTEDENLNLTAPLNRYAMLKTGVYLVEMVYNNGSEKRTCQTAVAVKNGWFYLPPASTLPDIPEGVAEVKFLGML